MPLSTHNSAESAVFRPERSAPISPSTIFSLTTYVILSIAGVRPAMVGHVPVSLRRYRIERRQKFLVPANGTNTVSNA